MTLPEARRTFANLMAKSRERGLTEPDRRRLAQARQLLRRAKRPAMNPATLRFRDLSIGEKFEFDREGFETSGMASGPWIKTGPRTYRPAMSDAELMADLKRRYGSYATKGMLRNMTKIRVGSVNVSVVRLNSPRRNPIELGYRSKKTGRGRHLSIGLERSQRSNPRRKVQRLGRALEVRYKREIGSQPGYYKHAIKSPRAGVYAIPPGWVYVGTKSVLITEKEPHV